MMSTQLNATLSAFEHIVTLEQILVSGVTESQVKGLVRRGELVRVRHGIYTSGEYWARQPPGPAREIVRARAVGLVMKQPFVFSHDSAAHLLGLAFQQPTRPWVHVTRPQVDGSRHLLGVRQHGALHDPDHVETLGSLQVLDAARTAVDLARQHGMRTGLGACDSARRLGASIDDLLAAVAPMSYWRGVNAARDAVAWCDPGADNPGESLARLAVIEAGCGRPITQFPVAVDGRVAWCDMVVGPQVVEFDGRVKYRPVEDGGVAVGDPGEIAWRERQRERAIIRSGLGVSRVVWDDLAPGAWRATVARIRHEVMQTVALLGPSPSSGHLEFARRLEPERRRRIRRPSAPAA